jgi:hypothetical protein
MPVILHIVQEILIRVFYVAKSSIDEVSTDLIVCSDVFSAIYCLQTKPRNVGENKDIVADKKGKTIECTSNIPSSFGVEATSQTQLTTVSGAKPGDKEHEGMVWIGGADFLIGGDNNHAAADEFPKHKVAS